MRLSLEEYTNWVSRELDSFVKPASAKGQKLLDEASRAINDAKRFFDDLAKKADRDMPNKKDPVSYRAARFLGHGAREASSALAKLEVPSEATWETLKGFRDALSVATRSMKEHRDRTARELSGLYILDMRSFGGATEKVSKAGNKLQDFVEGEGSSLQKSRTLSSIVSSIQEAKAEMIDRESELQQLLREETETAGKLQNLESELHRLTTEEPLKEVLEVERELRRESKEFRAVTLAHLRRPLRKLRDLSTRGEIQLSSDQREAIHQYINMPYKSFLSKASGGHLLAILTNLRDVLKEGKMAFKPRKTVRVLAQLDEILGDTRLNLKQQRGRELLSRRWKLLHDPACRNLYRARNDKAGELDHYKQARENLHGRKRSVEEKIRASRARLEELLKFAEARTREYLGQQIQLEPLSRSSVEH